MLDSPPAGEPMKDEDYQRNLFECLGLPEEGAELALFCGESPRSFTRPVRGPRE
jgi:hypothetical protein